MLGYRLVFVSGNRCFKVVTVDDVNADGLTWSEAVEHCRNDVPGYITDLASIRDSFEMGKYLIPIMCTMAHLAGHSVGVRFMFCCCPVLQGA